MFLTEKVSRKMPPIQNFIWFFPWRRPWWAERGIDFAQIILWRNGLVEVFIQVVDAVVSFEVGNIWILVEIQKIVVWDVWIADLAKYVTIWNSIPTFRMAPSKSLFAGSINFLKLLAQYLIHILIIMHLAAGPIYLIRPKRIQVKLFSLEIVDLAAWCILQITLLHGLNIIFINIYNLRPTCPYISGYSIQVYYYFVLLIISYEFILFEHQI